MKNRSINPIIQLTIDNKFVRRIDQTHILAELNYKYSGVYQCAIGKRKTYKKHKFILERDYDKSKLEEYDYILCIDENKNIIHKYKKLSEVEYDLFNFSQVSLCLSHKRNMHGGYIWLYSSNLHMLDDKIKAFKSSLNKEHLLKHAVLQYKGDKLVQRYTSVRDAVERGNFTRCCIMKCISGKQKTHLGYSFKYDIN